MSKPFKNNERRKFLLKAKEAKRKLKTLKIEICRQVHGDFEYIYFNVYNYNN